MMPACVTIVGGTRSTGESEHGKDPVHHGKAGRDGADGQDGMPGQNGKDGAPGSSGPTVVGSGIVVTQSRQVSAFSSVSVRGAATVLIDQNGTEALTIEAEDNLQPLLVSDVNAGVLTLGLRPGAGIQTNKPIVYRLSVKALKEIETSGSGEVQAKGLDGAQLTVSQSGSYKVTAVGKVSRLSVTLSGSGGFDGQGLASSAVVVDISGSAEAVVQAADKLEARVTGAGSVDYIGSPTVTQVVTGSGAVRKR